MHTVAEVIRNLLLEVSNDAQMHVRGDSDCPAGGWSFSATTTTADSGWAGDTPLVRDRAWSAGHRGSRHSSHHRISAPHARAEYSSCDRLSGWRVHEPGEQPR